MKQGSVVQLVRMPPCHGGGRGFESRPVRRNKDNPLIFNGFFYVHTSFSHIYHTFKVIPTQIIETHTIIITINH